MKKVLFSLLCCFVLVAGLPGVVLPAMAVAAEAPVAYKSVIRATPSYEGEAMGAMADGTGVRVLGRKGEFYKIDCYDMEGYIAASQVKEEKGSFYISCDPASSESEIMTYTPAGETLQLRQKLLTLAKNCLGAPYIYGSDGPWGFDCSGLTSYLYRNCDITISRRASLQMADGIIVAKAGIQVGDLLFFREPGETALVSHVGIYAGDNRMIHAGSEGVACVELTGEYFGDYFLCARRILVTETAPVTAGQGQLPFGLSGLSTLH